MKVGSCGKSEVIDSGFLWEGYHERRRCSRDTYPESYITQYTSIRRLFIKGSTCVEGVGHEGGVVRELVRKGNRIEIFVSMKFTHEFCHVTSKEHAVQ
jgi:hypothetical protein